jgi:regulator of sigma E protease
MDGVLYGLLAIVLFVVILGGLVLIHEIGHFVTARLLDVRVLEFGIGFPPRAKVLRARGETLWTLNWLPIGGFVRMDGEDGDGAGDPRAFSAKPLRVRLTILVAGVAMNIALAFVIFFAIALLATPVVQYTIGDVSAGSPAAAIGLKPDDRIVAVNDRPLDYLVGTDALRRRAGETVTLGIVRADGSPARLTATLRPPEQLSEKVGALGVSFRNVAVGEGYVGHDLGESVRLAGTELVHWGGLIFTGLGDLVTGFVNNPTAPPQAQGPVGIAVSLADLLLNSGIVLTLFVAGILSVNLAVVNILPFPPLDGGRMAMLLIKRLFGARVSLRAERLTYAIGFVFLMAFILWISGFDIARLGSTP